MNSNVYYQPLIPIRFQQMRPIDAKLRGLERSKKIYPKQLEELEQAIEKIEG